ncbi:MAG: hypothetical protein RQ885_00940 [Desulfurococcales archaeon]|nr:hypothetical protein [Desulfurococcales archaeon]
MSSIEVLYEIPIEDPECGSGSVMKVLRRGDPTVGNQISIVVICPQWSYRYFEEIPEDIMGGERVIIIEVNNPDDLSRKLFKSREATVTIPEIGLVSTPRSGAVDEITTVDGLLEKYIEHLEPMCNETENPMRCREVVEWMKRAMKGEERFTLIIEDPSGRSMELDMRI